MSEVANAVRASMPSVRADLEQLVRIPSVAFDGFDHSHVRAGAEAVKQLFADLGAEIQTIRHGDGQPSVVAKFPAPEGKPTVLLYAHQDVQPPGDTANWDQDDPYTVVERDGRLYGRGVADDKAGVMAHVAALRAFGGKPPVGVTVLIEGEEEVGSPTLDDLLAEHRDALRSDVVVIADSTNWSTDVPGLTTTLRGVVNCYVEVKALKQAVHSGIFGGPIPDALTSLTRLLATLHDAEGNVVVKGLAGQEKATLDYDADQLRRESGMLDATEFIGSGKLTDSLWHKPTATVLGFDGPRAAEAANALQPSARAKVSFRISPAQTAAEAYEAIKAHFAENAEWGTEVTVVDEGGLGNPCSIDTDGPRFDIAKRAFAEAWGGTETVELGIGGSIPMIATFQELFPEASILVTGVEDPQSQAHGPNESLDVEMFERACVAEALLLEKLAAEES
ncbi:dipeptidase [Salininema proteolyticum]|uniref:Dipeptidase n=1 Tax=Salininema proteolyticum TaxID=1607685 RepID=A0ABV8TT34_9ACTN